MESPRPQIWLMKCEPAPAAAVGATRTTALGCAGCTRPPSGDIAAPEMQGPSELLSRLTQALRQVMDPETGRDIVSEGWLRGMRLQPQEAELTLWARQPGCSTARVIAEDAFVVLRQELPDTDIFLHLVPLTSGSGA